MPCCTEYRYSDAAYMGRRGTLDCLATVLLTTSSVGPTRGLGFPLHAPIPLADSYGKLPLCFEANQGQTHPAVKFLSRGPGYALYLTSTGATLALGAEAAPGGRRTAAAVLRLGLAGSNPDAVLVGLEESSARSNY